MTGIGTKSPTECKRNYLTSFFFFYLTMLKIAGRLEVYVATRRLPNSFMIRGKSATENEPLINSPCLLFLIKKCWKQIIDTLSSLYRKVRYSMVKTHLQPRCSFTQSCLSRSTDLPSWGALISLSVSQLVWRFACCS